MRKDSTETGRDAKTPSYAEGPRLLEIVGPDEHAAILDELDGLEEIGLTAELPVEFDPVSEGTPEPSAACELGEPPLVGGPLGHDVGPSGRWLPPVAYSSAVWEAPYQEPPRERG